MFYCYLIICSIYRRFSVANMECFHHISFPYKRCSPTIHLSLTEKKHLKKYVFMTEHVDSIFSDYFYAPRTSKHFFTPINLFCRLWSSRCVTDRLSVSLDFLPLLNFCAYGCLSSLILLYFRFRTVF